MKIKVVLVDDDFSALTAIKNYCQEIQLEVVGSFTSPANFIEELDKLTFDIAILDYAMPQYNGMQLAEILNSKKIPIIFVTGHRDEIASQAWDMNCIACIEKPVNIEKLKSAIEKYTSATIKSNSDPEFLNLKIYGDAVARIEIRDIAFITSCEADTGGNDRYLQTFSKKGYRIVNKKMEDINNALPQKDFMRIGKSEIISKKAIHKYSQNLEEVTLTVDSDTKNICMNKYPNGSITFTISYKLKEAFRAWVQS